VGVRVCSLYITEYLYSLRVEIRLAISCAHVRYILNHKHSIFSTVLSIHSGEYKCYNHDIFSYY